jgi:glycosyltransferase involved in cell wall biosynthesis
MRGRPCITAAIRVKDAEHHVAKCLSSLSDLVDEIVVLDDGSTDRTVELCRQFPRVAHLLSWPKSFFHEGLDRNVVLAMAKDTRPDWILILDIDEVFEERAREVFPQLVADPEVAIWGFSMCHFWRGRTHYRVDGKWGEDTFQRAHLRLFRNQPGIYFPVQQAHGTVSMGVEGRAAPSGLRIRHHGYSDPAEARFKYDRYLTLQDGHDYSHLVDETGLVLEEWAEQRADGVSS